MNVIKLPKKHLLVIQISGDYPANHLNVIGKQLSEALGENANFIIAQPETEITLLTLED